MSSVAAAARAAKDSTLRDVRWQEDLNYLANELPAKQRDFFKLIPKEKFEKEIAELNGKIPQLSDWEIVLQLIRIVAGLGVAHTTVTGDGWMAQQVHVYPLKVEWFSDELAVVATAPEYREALGARVVRIGSLTPMQAEAAVAPYLAHENSVWLHFRSPGCMMFAELMQHEKIAGPDGRMQITLAKGDGKPFTLELTPVSLPEEKKAGRVLAWDVLPIPPTLYLKQLKAFYWYEYLPDTRALYIQYNKCKNDPEKPFEAFAKELFAFADSHPVQRVIVDLRFNAGGEGGVVVPLLEGLEARPALNANGHLYALIGSGTFSSGVLAASAFKHDLQAILVGESTGGKPNSYGEARLLVLPNSKLTVQYAVKYFRVLPGADPSSLEPDIYMPLSVNDFLEGRDPVLNAVLYR